MAATLFLADPSLPDNTAKPVSFESEDGEEVVFTISQSRSTSKVEGQDAIATALRGRWECCVLCDGHDLHGHLVARGICELLSTILLDKLEPLNIDSTEAEKAIIDAFEECEARVMWSNAVLQPNSFVRVIEGEWAGRVGYVSEVHDTDDTFSIIVVDAEAYHRPRLPRTCLTGSRFVGGSTCVAFVRDSQTNLVRIAVMGDTRAMVVNAPPAFSLEKDPIWENMSSKSTGSFLTFPHDVFNTAELARLKQEWHGEYEIDGPYLINPLTGCEIQPTRGFGDFDMFGTGYLSIPDVSHAFPLDPGTIVLVASDGIFDDAVWGDDFSVVSDYLLQQIKLGGDLEQIATALHNETVVRSKKSGYVDDISFFMCRNIPAPNPHPQKSNYGGIPRPPGRSLMAESGVDGLPTPAGSFLSHGSVALVGRESASLTEIEKGRRISNHYSLLGEEKDIPSSLSVVAASTAGNPMANHISQRMKRHSTADFIDPNAPRYLKEQRSEQSRGENHETIRRTRGPSFMLPEGLDMLFGDGEEGDVAMDLAVIGEDTELDSTAMNHPAEAVRTAIANKKKMSIMSLDGVTIATPTTIAAGSSSSSPGANGQPTASPSAAAGGKKKSLLGNNGTSSSGPTAAAVVAMPRPSMNAVLQRMAARYGHDPKQLDSLVRDLSVV